MKVEFIVVADLDTGELKITCPDIFESTNSGWGPKISTSYSDVYRQKIYTRGLLHSPIRAKFMNLAKLTKEELERAEAFEEDK